MKENLIKSFAEVKSFEALNKFLQQVDLKAGNFGGRKVKPKDSCLFSCGRRKLTLNDLVKKLNELNKQNDRLKNWDDIARQDKPLIYSCIESIRRLDDDGKKSVKGKNIVVKCLTMIRQTLGNVGYNRYKTLLKIGMGLYSAQPKPLPSPTPPSPPKPDPFILPSPNPIPPPPPPPLPDPDPFVIQTPMPKPEPIPCYAPLTLVRSEKPTPLKISLLFNEKMQPKDPIEPSPSEINNMPALSKYTWKVLTHNDGTMTTTARGQDKRIKMIWWEALRNEALIPVDSSKAVCVERSQIKEFLKAALAKLGVNENELQAFIHYWDQRFQHAHDPLNFPYLLVQLVDSKDVEKYIPKMEVESENGASFPLKRFYFRFAPIAQPNQGIQTEDYLKNLSSSALGPNVAIDLGGEIAAAPDSKPWAGEAAFNQGFIKEHIYVD